MLVVWHICLGYIIIGIVIGIIGLFLTPLMEYDGDNEVLFRMGDAAEALFGTLLGTYMMALPIIMVVCCYLTGQAFGELV